MDITNNTNQDISPGIINDNKIFISEQKMNIKYTLKGEDIIYTVHQVYNTKKVDPDTDEITVQPDGKIFIKKDK